MLVGTICGYSPLVTSPVLRCTVVDKGILLMIALHFLGKSSPELKSNNIQRFLKLQGGIRLGTKGENNNSKNNNNNTNNIITDGNNDKQGVAGPKIGGVLR